MILCRMTEKDIKEVCELEKSIFSSPWSEKSFLDAQKSRENVYLVAKEEGKIIGYCGIWTSFETADLCNMAVDASCRKRGIGYTLLTEAIKIIKEMKVEKLLLEVRESNQTAISLYRKIGFETIGVRKAYYSAPTEDAILMEYAC